MNGQIITMVEGNVPQEKWEDLQSGYNGIIEQSPPAGILSSFIMQERGDQTLWRLVTLWKDFDSLQAMQKSHSVPPGIKIFRDVDVNPNVKIFEVKAGFSR